MILLIKQDFCTENPFVFSFQKPVGIHLQTTFLREIPAEGQLLTFQSFVQITQGKFPDAVFPVKLTRQKVVDPVQIWCCSYDRSGPDL